MKKIYTLSSLIISLLVLTGCSKPPVEVVVDKVEVVDYHTKVEVPVEVFVYNYPETSRIYKPGIYTSSKVIENDTYYTNVVIDDYGRITSVYLDTFTENTLYFIDEETDDLYVYVYGVKDIIPNSYRLVENSYIPTIEDSITSKDLIEGYPEFDEKIEKLVRTNNASALTQDEEYFDAISNLTKKIIEDQTTNSVLMYQAGDQNRLVNVEEIDFDVMIYLELVQDLLDPLLLESDDITREINKSYKGLYIPGNYYYHSAPIIEDDSLSFINYNVVVDDFGKIVSVNLDQIINQNGVNTLRSIVDKEFEKNINLLESRIISNQGINAFSYTDDLDLSKTNLTFDSKNYITNFSTEFDVTPFIDIISKNEVNYLSNYSTYSGTYVNYYKDYVMTMNLYNGQVQAITLDELYSLDDAKFEINGQFYDLYTYEKVTYSNLDEDETELETFYVYKDDEEYYYAYANTDENHYSDVEVGDNVVFETSIFDEKKTLNKAHINATKNTLLDDEFLTNSNLYTNYIVKNFKEKGLNSIDIVDGKALNIEGLDIDIEDFNFLLYDTYYMATEKLNTYNNIGFVTTLNKALGDYKLADGNYYLRSDVPYNGDFYTLSYSVFNNLVVSAYLDKTIYEDTYLYSANDRKNFTNSSSYMLNTILFNDFSNGILEDFEYKDNDELEDDYTAIYKEDDLFVFNTQIENSILDGLKLRVVETINDVKDEIKDAFSESNLADNDFVVASDNELAGKLALDLDSVATIAFNYKVEIDFENSDLIEVDTLSNDYDFIFYSSADDVEFSKIEEVLYTIEYKGVSETSSKSIQVLSNNAFKQLVLNDEENDLINKENPFETVLNGKVFDLYLENNDLTRLGNESVVNKDYMFQVKLDDLNASVDNNEIEVIYNEFLNTYEIDSTISNYKTNNYILELSSPNNYKLKNSSGSIILDVVAGVDSTKPLERQNEIIREFIEDLILLESTNVTVYNSKDTTDTIEFTVFFDNYDQEEEFIKIKQSGEASRTYEFEVISDESAKRTVNRLTTFSFSNFGYLGSGLFDLLDTQDVEIDGITLLWNGYIKSADSNYDNLVIDGFEAVPSGSIPYGDTSKYVKAEYFVDEEEVIIGTGVKYYELDAKFDLNKHPLSYIKLNLNLNVFNIFGNEDVAFSTDSNGNLYAKIDSLISTDILTGESNLIKVINEDYIISSMSNSEFYDSLIELLKDETNIDIYYEYASGMIIDNTLNQEIDIPLKEIYVIGEDFGDFDLEVEWYDGEYLISKSPKNIVNLNDFLRSKVIHLDTGETQEIELTAKIKYDLNGFSYEKDHLFEIIIYNNGY